MISWKGDATLLVVEDEDDLREFLVEKFTGPQLKVLQAAHGVEALKVLESAQVDAILSDIRMPQMTGSRLLEVIRERGLQTPVVFLTGYADKDNVVQVLRYGAFDFLEKPFDLPVLTDTVHRAIELGVSIRNIDDEVEALLSGAGVPQELRDRYHELQRDVLLLRRKNQVHLKDGGKK